MLTQKKVLEAIEQMKISCDLKEANGYEPVSARGLLNELGYNADVEWILQLIYNGGFTYCLDHWFPSKAAALVDSENGPTWTEAEYPCVDACYWGPDQLKSRLESLFFVSAES